MSLCMRRGFHCKCSKCTIKYISVGTISQSQQLKTQTLNSKGGRDQDNAWDTEINWSQDGSGCKCAPRHPDVHCTSNQEDTQISYCRWRWLKSSSKLVRGWVVVGWGLELQLVSLELSLSLCTVQLSPTTLAPPKDGTHEYLDELRRMFCNIIITPIPVLGCSL